MTFISNTKNKDSGSFFFHFFIYLFIFFLFAKVINVIIVAHSFRTSLCRESVQLSLHTPQKKSSRGTSSSVPKQQHDHQISFERTGKSGTGPARLSSALKSQVIYYATELSALTKADRSCHRQWRSGRLKPAVVQISLSPWEKTPMTNYSLIS